MDFFKNLFGGISKGAGNLFSGIGNLFGGGQSGGPQPIQPAQTQQLSSGSLWNSPYQKGAPNIAAPKSSGGSDWMSNLFPGGKTAGIAGLMAPAIGNMFAPKVKDIPDFNSLPSVQAMQNFRPGKSVSPEYQKMIQSNVNQLRDQKVRELQALYHNARPGTDYLTDTNYQRDLALLDQGIQDNLTDELAKAESTFSGQEQERLSQLAQLDIYQIMAQTGISAQEASDFKEMFSNVGNTFLTRATRNPNEMSDIMSLFGRR